MVDQYVPGTCNIGPAEIALRRRAGHAGLATTAVLAAALVLLVALPLWQVRTQQTQGLILPYSHPFSQLARQSGVRRAAAHAGARRRRRTEIPAAGG